MCTQNKKKIIAGQKLKLEGLLPHSETLKNAQFLTKIKLKMSMYAVKSHFRYRKANISNYL